MRRWKGNLLGSATGVIFLSNSLPCTPLWDWLKSYSLGNGDNSHKQKLGTSKTWKGWVVGAEPEPGKHRAAEYSYLIIIIVPIK